MNFADGIANNVAAIARAMKMIEIFAIDENGLRKRIDDLYWFEENGIHNFGGEGHYGEKHTFEIYVDGSKVYPIETLLGLPIVESDNLPQLKEGDIIFGDFSCWTEDE